MSLYLCTPPEGEPIVIGCESSTTAARMAGIPVDPEILPETPIEGVVLFNREALDRARELREMRREQEAPIVGLLAVNS